MKWKNGRCAVVHSIMMKCIFQQIVLLKHTFLHVIFGKGSPSASQGIASSLPASCLYSPPGTTENLGGSCSRCPQTKQVRQTREMQSTANLHERQEHL